MKRPTVAPSALMRRGRPYTLCWRPTFFLTFLVSWNLEVLFVGWWFCPRHSMSKNELVGFVAGGWSRFGSLVAAVLATRAEPWAQFILFRLVSLSESSSLAVSCFLSFKFMISYTMIIYDLYALWRVHSVRPLVGRALIEYWEAVPCWDPMLCIGCKAPPLANWLRVMLSAAQWLLQLFVVQAWLWLKMSFLDSTQPTLSKNLIRSYHRFQYSR